MGQGDPLSPLLCVLCVEVLASLIRRSPAIEGFLLPGALGRQARVRLYADATTVLLRNVSSLASLLDCINNCEKGSGAKLNSSNSEAMWLGAWRSRPDEPFTHTWVAEMKILGFFFGNVNVQLDNWQPKLNKLEKSLSLLRARSLSLLCKSLIVNVLGFSKFTYLARVLPIPSWVLTSINALVWPFL